MASLSRFDGPAKGAPLPDSAVFGEIGSCEVVSDPATCTDTKVLGVGCCVWRVRQARGSERTTIL